jgi:hypothetical protein
MGRQENHIIGDGPVANLGHALRELRSETGLTYRDMCAIANYSRTALNIAAAGRKCPTWEVVQAFITACGGEVNDRWHSLWKAAQATSAGRPTCVSPTEKEEPETTTGNSDKPTAKSLVRLPNPWQETPSQFVYELRLLRAQAGRPSAAEISRAWDSAKLPSNGRRHLPKSTLSDSLKLGRNTLPDLVIVKMIVWACDANVGEWTAAWQAIAALEFEARNPRPEPTPPTLPFLAWALRWRDS